MEKHTKFHALNCVASTQSQLRSKAKDISVTQSAKIVLRRGQGFLVHVILDRKKNLLQGDNEKEKNWPEGVGPVTRRSFLPDLGSSVNLLLSFSEESRILGYKVTSTLGSFSRNLKL